MKKRIIVLVVTAVFITGAVGSTVLMGSELHKLVKKGKTEKVKEYLQLNPGELNSKDKYNWTALQLAAATGREDIVKLLLNKGASLNDVDEYGFSALHLAALKGKHKIFEMLVDHGAVLQTDTRAKTVSQKIFETTAIRDELVDLLFNNPDDKNRILNRLAQKKQGDSVVFARLNMEESWIDVKLERDLASNDPAAMGQLKISPDALQQLRSLADKFVAKRIDTRKTGNIGNTLLHIAVQDGDLIRVNKFIKSNPKWVNTKNYFGITPLHYAAAGGFVDVARKLVQAGAKVNTKTSSGVTPLYGAVSEKKEDMVRFLIANGADVKVTTYDGATMLHIASTKPIAELLVTAGAKVREPNKFGFTPLHIAAHYGHVEVAKYLLTRGSRLESRTNTGWTPLCEAVYGKQAEMVEFLASRGANVNARTIGGSTPMELAVSFKDTVIADILKKHGALPVVAAGN